MYRHSSYGPTFGAGHDLRVHNNMYTVYCRGFRWSGNENSPTMCQNGGGSSADVYLSKLEAGEGFDDVSP